MATKAKGKTVRVTTIAARERVLPRLAAQYVFARGKGDAAYRLTRRLEDGPDRSKVLAKAE